MKNKYILIILILVLSSIFSSVMALGTNLNLACGGDKELIIACGPGDEDLIFLPSMIDNVGGKLPPPEEPKRLEINLLIFLLPILFFICLIFLFVFMKKRGKKQEEIIP